MTPWKNKLYYGDNLRIMRDNIADESVDLIYLDPPFNSKATYNVLFREKNGSDSSAQITAFDDTWHWDMAAEETHRNLVVSGQPKLAELMLAFRSFLGQNDMMAYLTMMAVRLVEMNRVLKPTGSIYLHCDPTASHYLKILMDGVFGAESFRNEIIWKRMTPSGFKGKTSIGRGHDVILCYSKLSDYFYYPIYIPYSNEYIAERFNKVDEQGRRFKDEKIGTATKQETIDRLLAERRIYYTSTGKLRIKHYLDEIKGKPLDDVWVDIPPINSQAAERLGYPTQKPEALLERIIRTSSNEGDLVLDPFCGCGTTVSAAEKLNRRWIGIDITHLAITLIKHRIEDSFRQELSPFEIIGDPKDLESARTLAKADKYQFEWWALSLVDSRPAQDKKKGSDRGVDGYMYFIDYESGQAKKVVVQVKSGHVSASQIRDLKGAVDREKAAIGVFITLQEPTGPMKIEAAAAGFYETEITASHRVMRYPRIQILTIEELLSGKCVEYPQWAEETTIKKAARVRKKGNEPEQQKLL